MRSFLVSALLVVAAAACGSSKPAATTTPANTAPAPTAATPTGAAAGDTPAAGQIVCHLDCSHTEAKASGATEEEARANLRPFIEKQCKPEDGQYFVFCDPPK